MISVESIYKVYENQSWLDVSNHIYGIVDYSFELAMLNNASISDRLKAGQEIKYNADNLKDIMVLKSLMNNKSIPATAMTDELSIAPQRGIGVMVVEKTFKVD